MKGQNLSDLTKKKKIKSHLYIAYKKYTLKT